MRDIHYESVEDAYKKLSPELFNFARQRLIDKDQYIDAVNEAFIKVIEWQKRNPNGHISHKQIFRIVLRQCRLMNRHMRMISIHDPAMAGYLRSVHAGTPAAKKAVPHSDEMDSPSDMREF